MKNHLPTHPAAVLALAFLATIGVGTVLLMLPWASASGQSAPWLTALFTATSAVCVTGLVVVDTGTYWSPLGQGLVMALFQLGGFGMMTSATLMGLLIGGHMKLRTRLLLQSETHALSLGDVRSVARMVLVVTVLVEGVVALWLAIRFATTMDIGWGEALWQGAFHAVSAYNNAGFSTWPDSVMRHVTDGWVLGPLMLAIVVGGLGISSHHGAVGQPAQAPHALVDPHHADGLGLGDAGGAGHAGAVADRAQQPQDAGAPGSGRPVAGGVSSPRCRRARRASTPWTLARCSWNLWCCTVC